MGKIGNSIFPLISFGSCWTCENISNWSVMRHSKKYLSGVKVLHNLNSWIFNLFIAFHWKRVCIFLWQGNHFCPNFYLFWNFPLHNLTWYTTSDLTIGDAATRTRPVESTKGFKHFLPQIQGGKKLLALQNKCWEAQKSQRKLQRKNCEADFNSLIFNSLTGLKLQTRLGFFHLWSSMIYDKTAMILSSQTVLVIYVCLYVFPVLAVHLSKLLLIIKLLLLIMRLV